jgi:hypothetical protein
MSFVYKTVRVKGFAMSLVEERLKSFGFLLPPVVKKSGLFVPYVVSDSMIYLSGKGAPVRPLMEIVPKVGADVNAVPNFMQHTEVINGCPDVFLKAFGERGQHARSAVLEAVVEFS